MCGDKSIHTKKQFSWSNSNQSLQSRIDRIYLPRTLIPINPKPQVMHFRWPDHDIVVSTIKISNIPPPGPGTWKLNTSLLDDKNYVDIINCFLVQWRDEKQYFDNLSTWWDIGKLGLR